jgi:UDP-glucose 4-epimerase
MNLCNVYAGSNVMITGGLGFIGSNLAHHLVELGANVLLVDSLIPNYGGNLFNVEAIKDRVRINIADMRDTNGMRYLVRDQEYIFNLAGQVSHLDSMTDPFTDLDINGRSQLSLLEACRQHNPCVKIVFASTRQVYGKPHYLPVDEQHPLQPADVNGIHKLSGEWYHLLYNNVYHIRSSVLRLTNTYGPRQYVRTNRQSFIGWFVHEVLDNKEITLYGDGSQLRDMAYVDDVVAAFLRAGASDAANGQVFNVGGSVPVSLLELTRLLIEIAGSGSYRLVPFPPEKQSIDIGSFLSDYQKIEQILGWYPTVDLPAGLCRMVEYYKQHKAYYW